MGRGLRHPTKTLTLTILKQLHHLDSHRILSAARILQDPIGFGVGLIHLGRHNVIS